MSSADPLPTSVLVVSAVYNNAATVGELHRRLEAATHRAGLEARFLYVDDGSLDDSWSIIRRLAAAHRTVAGIRLAGNFGQTRALCAGLESARADVVVYIDADLEVPPEAVELLAPEIFAGHDFVGGARSPRDRHAVRRAGARAFNALTRILTGLDVQDVGCGLVAMGPNVVDAVIDAMRNRPVQIIKPTMMFAATNPIEVRIPSVSPQNSSHTKRMLIRFAIEFLTLEATVSASERAGRREGSTGRASRSARIVHAAMRAVAAAVPPV
ncbi:MAG: glycosyltransferase, partial [Microthrixaceae bacterium]